MDSLKEMGHSVVIIAAHPHYPSGLEKGFSLKPLQVHFSEGVLLARVFVPPLPHKGIFNRLVLFISFCVFSLQGLPFIRDADAVWAYDQRFFSLPPALICRLVSRAKVIMDTTDMWPEALVNAGLISNGGFAFKAGRLLASTAYHLCDRVTTLTEAMKQHITLVYGLPEARIVVLPGSPRLESYSPLLNADNKFTMMYAGNLGLNYDLMLLPVAMCDLLPYSEIKLIIRGRGELAENLGNAIDEMSLANVELRNGFLDDSTHLVEMSSADAFVLPMKRCPFPDASFPIKFIEYLSFGRPVICLADGYLATLVDSWGLGFALRPGDSEGLIDSVIQLFKNRSLREVMSSQALQLFRAKYSSDALKTELEQLLH